MTAPQRMILTADSRPYLPRHILLRDDKVRGRWVLLAPERVLVPEDTAVAILRLLDGKRRLQDVAQELAQIYDAPPELIVTDAIEVLQDLADRGFLRLNTTEGSDV